MAEARSATATVQLVRPAGPAARRSMRLGVGLLVSLAVGWPVVGRALTDPAAFEASVVHFLVVVALCVAAVLLLGSLYDHLVSTAPATEEVQG